jgi:putative ABC transport system permease protein
MNTFLQDINYTLRMLIKKKTFTVVVVITLAVGIGATSIMYSIVHAVLLRSLSYPDPENLVMVWETHPQRGWQSMTVSYPNYADWREQNKTFIDLGAFLNQEVTLMEDGETERVQVTAVTASMFPILGTPPAKGRAFVVEEDRPGNNRVAIISHALWQHRFGADANILDKNLTINNVTFKIVGVMPPEFQLPPPVKKDDKRLTQADIWIPLGLDPAKQLRTSHNLFVVGRVKPGNRLMSAQEDMDSITRQLLEQYPASNTGYGARVVTLHSQVVGDIQRTLWVLLGAVGFVLLLACTNVASLLMAQAASRQKEIGIRVALGASRRRIVRQLLTESLVLAILGGSLGLLMATWGVELLVAFSDDPRLKDVTINLWVMGFTLFVSLLSLIIFGLAPTLKLSNPDLNQVLKEGGRVSTQAMGRRHLRSLIIVSESALVLVLLIGAGLLIRSYVLLQDAKLGFDPGNVVTMKVHLTPSKYSEPQQQQVFFRQAFEGLKSLPGVESVAAVTSLPLTGESLLYTFNIKSRPVEPELQQVAEYHMVSPDYFKVMGIPFIKGRPFTDADAREGVGVVIINEKMAAHFWPNQEALGETLAIENPAEVAKYGKLLDRQIVGIVGNVTHSSVIAPPKPEIYIPYFQNPTRSMTMVLRTVNDPGSLIPSLRSTVQSSDSQVPVYNVKKLDQVVSDSIAQRKLSVLILTIFASIGLLLAAIGIYGVISYFVTERTHEIGLRMALGANRGDVLKLVLTRGMKPVLLGLVIGLAGAVALTRVLANLLFEIKPTDMITFLLASAFFIIVALLACYVPASRATRVDPTLALRGE